jgi:hypothetical protein
MVKKMKNITDLQAAMKPLTEGRHPPAERLPEPEYINVSREEYNRLFEAKKDSVMINEMISNIQKELEKKRWEQPQDMFLDSTSEVRVNTEPPEIKPVGWNWTKVSDQNIPEETWVLGICSHLISRDGREDTIDDDEKIKVLRWIKSGENIYWETSDNTCKCCQFDLKVNHWMPLPPLPKDDQ